MRYCTLSQNSWITLHRLEVHGQHYTINQNSSIVCAIVPNLWWGKIRTRLCELFRSRYTSSFGGKESSLSRALRRPNFNLLRPLFSINIPIDLLSICNTCSFHSLVRLGRCQKRFDSQPAVLLRPSVLRQPSPSFSVREYARKSTQITSPWDDKKEAYSYHLLLIIYIIFKKKSSMHTNSLPISFNSLVLYSQSFGS